jgi:hypothetical protein
MLGPFGSTGNSAAELSTVENTGAYLEPKQLAHKYGLAYSTFQKHLKVIVQSYDYPPEAFRVPKQNPSKREHARVRIHRVYGVAVLDRYFSARRTDVF